MDEKKPSTSTNSTPPAPAQPTVSSQPTVAPPVKSPLISRRRFLQGALAASAILAAASVGASGQILGPQVPTPLPPQVIADWNVLDQKYQSVKGDRTTKGLYNEMNYSQFFYWQYAFEVPRQPRVRRRPRFRRIQATMPVPWQPVPSSGRCSCGGACVRPRIEPPATSRINS